MISKSRFSYADCRKDFVSLRAGGDALENVARRVAEIPGEDTSVIAC